MSNPTECEHFAIYIVGHDAYPVAMFRCEEHAKEWARECYFGNWLMKKVTMPLVPFATKEEWEEARKRVEKDYGWIRDIQENDKVEEKE